jgi:hypothetical protein
MFWKSSLVLGAALYIAAFPASAQQSAEFDACMAQADVRFLENVGLRQSRNR